MANQVMSLEIGGEDFPVTLRRDARARRYVLRLSPRGDTATLTLPKRAPLHEARAFLAAQADWLAARKAPKCDNLVPGAILFLRGVRHEVRLSGRLRGLPSLIPASGEEPAILLLSGEAAHVRRRAIAFLQGEARADLTAATERHAKALGVRVRRISLKDTRSRWGSATRTGVLSFSWRLILAPPFVLDYLAAHEVAHLVEMNHSSRFWALCRRLAPRSDEARLWLRQNGRALHRMI